jgi:hypothetical protein
VFPFPLAFAASDEGFTVDLPVVTASANTIAAPFAGGLDIALGSTSFEVVRYDTVSVTLEYSDDGGAVGTVTIAEGSPVVSFTAARDTVLRPAEALKETADGVWETHADDALYGVRSPEASYHDGGLEVRAGSTAQWFPVPDDSNVDAWAQSLTSPVTGVEVTYKVDEESATTRLTYADEGTTVVAAFPGREPGGNECSLGTFATAYGISHACATAALEWSVPRLQAQSAYDLDGLDDARRQALVAQLAADVDAIGPMPADTYFGGKSLARVAGFLSLAQDLDETAIADKAADLLWEELRTWTEPEGCETRDARCFVYDDALRLVVGKTPSFGSEEGNDHHFHYGYFLAAGAALADYRPETADTLAPVLDALAADIATGAEDVLPALRAFDPYRGHSWASGVSPFADGNNQESSSEAVAAWNGLGRWARVRADEALTARADWMLSAEAAAARSLWLEPDLDDIPAGFDHGIVSLTWGGKRDYATWFSPEPSAILGIQLLPVGPLSLEYLAGSPERVDANVEEAGGPDAYRELLGDYVLMYSALGGDGALDAAEQAASELEDEDLDDGNSRSGILAWLAAVRLAQEP